MIKLPISVVGLVLFCGQLLSCSSGTLPDYGLLGDLRVLAIIANSPEINPGGAVTFTPILSDLKGAGRTLNYAVQGCLDPGVGLGASVVCRTSDPTYTSLSGTVTPAAGTSQTYTGAVATFSVTMPIDTLAFASRTTADQYNGVSYLVIYTVSVPNGGPTVSSFTRVLLSISTKTQKNSNPVVTSIDLNESAVATPMTAPTVVSNFRVTAPAGSTESYSVMQSDGSTQTKTEQLIHTWFMSDGAFAYNRTLDNTQNQWTPPASQPTTRGQVIFVVTRDGRNGAAFQRLDLTQ